MPSHRPSPQTPRCVGKPQLSSTFYAPGDRSINLAIQRSEPGWQGGRPFRSPLEIELCHVCRNAPHTTIDDHVHPYLELTHVLRGCMDCRVESTSFRVREGESLLVPPGLLHTRKTLEKETRMLGMMFRLTGEPFGNALSRETESQRNVSLWLQEACEMNSFRLPSDESLTDAIKRILRMAQEYAPHTPLALNGYLQSLTGILLRHLCATENGQKDSKKRPSPHFEVTDNTSGTGSWDDTGIRFCARIEAYLTANLSFSPSLSEIAAYAGRSARHINRMFIQHKGETVTAACLRLKLQQAQRLLRETDHPIKSVATLCGFGQNTAYFCHWFHKVAGETPLSYRRST